jgi:hypothetical protein
MGYTLVWRGSCMAQAIALISWIFVFLVFMGAILIALFRLIRRDTTNYDNEFLWEGKHSLEDLELKERKPEKPAGKLED